MIAVRLMGGLGNQMFQYAVATYLAQRLNTSAVMDKIFFENIADVDTPRHYELDCFNLKEKFMAPAKRPIENPESNYLGNLGKLRLAKDKLAGKAWQIYREPHHNYDPQVLNLPDWTYLIGYWQTEKYFMDIRQQILKDFSFKTTPSTRNNQLLKEITATNSVSLHVRRGDYVSNKHANKFHGTKDLAYYKTALKPVLKQTKNPVLFIFSDDPEWCKQNLKFPLETIYVEGNKKGSEDLRLMVSCQHNIIANSSFSWWAAWLNQNPNKVVVAPKQWFNDPRVNVTDVIPEAWLKI